MFRPSPPFYLNWSRISFLVNLLAYVPKIRRQNVHSVALPALNKELSG